MIKAVTPMRTHTATPIENIEHEFKFGDLMYDDAIEELQKLGMSSRDAVEKVEEWFDAFGL